MAVVLRRPVLLVFLFLGWLGAQAQGPIDSLAAPPPKRELRGFWIASVENIDWPTTRGESPVQYRAEYRRLLDAGQRAGLNAVFVQIRPASDALYKSELEPWSKWLTGQQGRGPVGDADPLPYLINEAHKRGMEFHAWFNPYRASLDTMTRRLGALHPYRTHPEWFIWYGKTLLYNPGLPAVRAHITRVIMDVVKRYDIDAVHFDDYFYPYQEPGLVFHDESTFAQRPEQDIARLDDWRRNNVNILIRDLHDSIRTAKRWVKFGISPFGVWMNKSADPNGSDTRAGQPSYSALYADTRLWLQKGWIDYVVPQLYWSTNFRLVPYATMLDWWTRNRYGRHLYVGHGTYRMLESTRSDTTWRNPRELPRQVRLNRSYGGEVSGSVFFSAKSLRENPLHTTDSLRLNLFRAPALVPTMPWLDAVPPRPVAGFALTRAGRIATLSWQAGPPAADGDLAAYYVLYRFGPGEYPTPDDPRHIIALPRAGAGRGTTFIDTTAKEGLSYAYYLTAVDRLHNESRPVNLRTNGQLPTEIVLASMPGLAAAPTPAIMPAAPEASNLKFPKLGALDQPAEPEGSTKFKVKTKTKKRGFFARLFGGG
ncbi:glycoside hydrolase family 10 protein [Hymenobacter nivis]|uniref:Glycoside hydrolase n=1 Tax=Hymenobacter nivis TaxID=1850093 RepID=A0A2Z3GUH7_9BACT|nr:family 10 glycosylhydrolase [Hymenobacter nivis]AWM33064.1 glycoside hydrolase [Hymenobacter nivis]